MLAFCMGYGALSPSAGLLPERHRIPDVSNETAFVNLLRQDPCMIDPAVCAGASNQQKAAASQRYTEPDFTSSLRLTSIMLNLQSIAHSQKMVDCVVVFPGYAEEERIEAGIAFAERLGAGTLYVAGPPESDKDSALEWTLDKITAKRNKLGYGGNGIAPYGIVVENEPADVKRQADQAAAFFKQTPQARRIVLVTTSWHMTRAYLTLVKSVMAEMGDVRAVQLLPMVAPRPLGQDVRYYLRTSGGAPKPQSSAADSEQVRTSRPHVLTRPQASASPALGRNASRKTPARATSRMRRYWKSTSKPLGRGGSCFRSYFSRGEAWRHECWSLRGGWTLEGGSPRDAHD